MLGLLYLTPRATHYLQPLLVWAGFPRQTWMQSADGPQPSGAHPAQASHVAKPRGAVAQQGKSCYFIVSHGFPSSSSTLQL